METKKTETYITRNKKELYVKLTEKKGRLKYERVCLHCSRDFISNRSTALYCSDDCRVKEYRRKKKEKEHNEWLKATRERLLKLNNIVTIK